MIDNDHSKYAVHGFCKLLPVSRFDAVYTDFTGPDLPENIISVPMQ